MWLFTDNYKKLQHIKSISDIPENCIGFVYIITNMETGKFYVGKKQIILTQNKRLGKKETKTQVGRGRKRLTKKITTESNWLTYTGSSIPLNEDINKLGRDKFIFKILQWCYTKKQLSYYEIKYQIIYGVLEKPELTYNQSILGKFFATDLK
jgi:hypothetical protein